MSLPHDKVSPSTRILTTKTEPDNEEMQLRLKLLKHDGYEIDESKIKSWGPNLQKMWSEISGKYIYVNNKPYIAAQQEEPQVTVYVSMDNKKRYNPLEGVAKSPDKNLIKLLTLEQYQTPFYNTTLIDNQGRAFRRNKFEEIEFENESVNPGSDSDEYKSKFVLFQRPITERYGPMFNKKITNINPFYNDLILKGMRKPYDFSLYSSTPTELKNHEIEEIGQDNLEQTQQPKQIGNTAKSILVEKRVSNAKPKIYYKTTTSTKPKVKRNLIKKDVKQNSQEQRFDPISGMFY